MSTAQKSTIGATQAAVLVQARIPSNLAHQAKMLADGGSGKTLSDVIREALEAEVSRRTLCKPAAEPTIADLAKSIEQLKSVAARQDAQARLIVALLESIAQAVGVLSGSAK